MKAAPGPIERMSRADQLASAMTRRIGAGPWVAGARLPATRELAEQFGTSRKTVLDALDLLAKRKLISRRQRQGCFIEAGVVRAEVARKTQVGVVVIGGFTPELQPLPRDMNRDWGTSIMGGMQPEMFQAGKMMTLVPAHLFDKDPLPALLERVESIGASLAGIISFSLPWPAKLLRAFLAALAQRQIPYVTINRASDLSNHNFVSPDYIGGTRLLGRCLARMGMERVVLLGTRAITRSHSEVERVGGLFEGYVLEGVSTRQIAAARCADFNQDSGYEAMRRYLDEQPAPQAVVAMGDFLAQGAIRALTERGLRVPEDVGVVGGTGLPQAREMSPAITTLSLPMAEMGRQAMRMLLEMERADMTRMTGRTIPGELVVRQSLPIPEEIQRDLAEESETWSFASDG